MRVHLSRRRPAEDREQGAIAILVAASTVIIVVLAAFSVDFGMAYVSKRDLQKGADAAALAAASEIVKRTNPTQSCATIASRFGSDAAFRNAVITAADAYATDNEFLDAQRQDIQVRCSSDNKRVEVFYSHTGSTPGLFGSVFSGVGDLTAQRDATADVFVRDEGTGLRPYFICDGDLNNRLKATLTTGGYVDIRYPSLDANCTFYSGNWYTSDCPDDGNNGTLDENTRNGCLSSVGVVIDQTTTPPPTQAQINAAVVAACTDATGAASYDPATCLVANPGNVAANNVVQAWDYLLTLPGIALPTFNQAWNDYATAQISRCRGGNNGCYPIEAIAAVKVCAYKWGNNKTRRSTDTAACPGISSLVFPNDNDNYLYLKLTNLQYSGSSSPGGCPVGGNCDLGGRGTRLID